MLTSKSRPNPCSNVNGWSFSVGRAWQEQYPLPFLLQNSGLLRCDACSKASFLLGSVVRSAGTPASAVFTTSDSCANA